MIEPIVFDLSTSGLELTELWKLATLYGSLMCLIAWSTSFLIHAVFGFLHDIF